ncbi:MAG: hypothetical protein WA021_05885 [Minisyncoccia bacterium]
MERQIGRRPERRVSVLQRLRNSVGGGALFAIAASLPTSSLHNTVPDQNPSTLTREEPVNEKEPISDDELYEDRRREGDPAIGRKDNPEYVDAAQKEEEMFATFKEFNTQMGALNRVPENERMQAFREHEIYLVDLVQKKLAQGYAYGAAIRSYEQKHGSYPELKILKKVNDLIRSLQHTTRPEEDVSKELKDFLEEEYPDQELNQYFLREFIHGLFGYARPEY